MARLRLRALGRALSIRNDVLVHVHFHSGPQGLPAACYDERCTSPRLDV